jgi:hypothetical protein
MTIRAPHFTVQQPRARLADFQFRNVVLEAFAQLRVFSVGEVVDETVPVQKQRVQEFTPRNTPLLAAAQARVAPVGEAAIDARPAVLPRLRADYAQNLLPLSAVTAAPFTNEFYDRPSPIARVQDTLPPNIPILAAAQLQVQPVGEVQTEPRPTPSRNQDFPFPNLLLIQPPIIRTIFERPAAQQIKQQDVIFPNLLAIQPTAGAPITNEFFDRPAPIARVQDVLPPNIPILAVAQAQVQPVGETSIDARPAAVPRLRVDLLQNLLLTKAATAAPFTNEIFDRPPIQARQQDFQFPNLLAATFSVSFAPAIAVWGAGPQAQVWRIDFQPPNLLIIQPTAAAAPPFSPIFDRPVAVRAPVDAPLPNLLTSTLSVAAVKPPFVFIFDRPAAAGVPRDAAPVNTLITTLSTVQGTPLTRFFFEQPPSKVQPRDPAVPNILVTALSTVQGTIPVVPGYFLFADRPSPHSPPQDQAPVNYSILQPPPPARKTTDWLVRARRRGQRQGLGR